MRTPKQMLIVLCALWAAGHALLSFGVVWAFAADKSNLSELLTYYLIAWQPLMAISIYGETRNAYTGQRDNSNIAIPSLAVIAATWLAWQITH